MNNDLISRSALIENYERFLARASIDPIIRAFMTSVLCTVENAPTVDAEPVRYGEFTELPLQDIFVTANPKRCESCKTEFILLFRKPYRGVFCPRCGARRKMDAEVEG